MTVFYFTSTGNCLAVAKKLDGNLVSIPQAIDTQGLHFQDDSIGLVFPIYGFGWPKMVQKFLQKATWEADYSFAIGTYGNLPGAAMMNLQNFVKNHGQRFDYAASLLMVDNYLPGFDMNAQVAKLPEKRVDEHLAQIMADIQNRRKQNATAGLGWKAVTALMKPAAGLILNGKQARQYTVDENCIRCRVCAKVCPAGNITVSEKVVFAEQCEGCLGCVHLCPQNAIHMRHEKSAARWRNPEVSLNELIAANNRQKEAGK